jgi:hypothetical protein
VVPSLAAFFLAAFHNLSLTRIARSGVGAI